MQCDNGKWRMLIITAQSFKHKSKLKSLRRHDTLLWWRQLTWTPPPAARWTTVCVLTFTAGTTLFEREETMINEYQINIIGRQNKSKRNVKFVSSKLLFIDTGWTVGTVDEQDDDTSYINMTFVWKKYWFFASMSWWFLIWMGVGTALAMSRQG